MLKVNAMKVIFPAIFVLGIALMTFMIIVESEPGAIPLFMVTLGAFGCVFTWLKSRALGNTKNE